MKPRKRSLSVDSGRDQKAVTTSTRKPLVHSSSTSFTKTKNASPQVIIRKLASPRMETRETKSITMTEPTPFTSSPVSALASPFCSGQAAPPSSPLPAFFNLRSKKCWERVPPQVPPYQEPPFEQLLIGFKIDQ